MKEKSAKEGFSQPVLAKYPTDASCPVRWITANLDSAALAHRLGQWLQTGTNSSHHAAHLLQLATVDTTGGPQLRTVVLRGAEPAAHWLRFHTDLRSPKYEEIRKQPRVALLGYDPNPRLQVRIDAVAAIHHKDPLARLAWERTPASSRASYASRRAPGEPVKDGTFAPPVTDADEVGFAHFVVVHCAIEVIDLLELDNEGHRRGTLVRTQGDWFWQPVTS